MTIHPFNNIFLFEKQESQIHPAGTIRAVDIDTTFVQSLHISFSLVTMSWLVWYPGVFSGGKVMFEEVILRSHLFCHQLTPHSVKYIFSSYIFFLSFPLVHSSELLGGTPVILSVDRLPRRKCTNKVSSFSKMMFIRDLRRR